MKKSTLLYLIALIAAIMSTYTLYDVFGPNLFWRAGINRLGIPYIYWSWILLVISASLLCISIILLIWGKNLKYQQANKS